MIKVGITGSNAAAQIKAFDDTWHWDKASVGVLETLDL